MHLKLKGNYVVGVFLLSAITATTIPPVCWCKPAGQTGWGPRGETDTGVMTQYGERTGRTSTAFENEDGGRRLEPSGGKPVHSFTHSVSSSARRGRVTAPNNPQQSEQESMYPSAEPSREHCSPGHIQHVVPGRFYVTGHLEVTVPHVGYQSDSALSGADQVKVKGHELSSSAEGWQRLQPEVECGDDAMTLTVRRRRAVQLLLDPANGSSVPLSQLPAQCGYLVHTSWRHLRLTAPYDACHVTQQGDSYVLPLLWRGTPVKMACPVSVPLSEAVAPPSLCCSTYGMTVTIHERAAAQDLRVKVRGSWTPLASLAQQCGYAVDRQNADIVVTVPFVSCGITVKDGKHTLVLQVGEQPFTLACPIPLLEDPPLTHQPLASGPDLTRLPSDSLPWAPPFVLAPPYYPHPQYQPTNPGPDAHQPTSSDPKSNERPLPPGELQRADRDSSSSSPSSTDVLQDSTQVFSDLPDPPEQPSTTDLPSHTGAPSLQPPSHVFYPYYHYYHHPKIPRSSAPEQPDPGLQVLEETARSHGLDVPLWLQPPEPSAPHVPPVNPALRSAPFHQHVHPYDVPVVTWGDPIKLSAPRSSADRDTNAPDLSSSPLPSELPDLEGFSSNTEEPNMKINLQKRNPEGSERPLLSAEDIKDKVPADPVPSSHPEGSDPVVAPPEQPYVLNFSSSNDHLLYYYYFYPYYYQMYYGLLGANTASPTLSKEASDLLFLASSPPVTHDRPETTASTTESMSDRKSIPHSQYYHLHFCPETSEGSDGLRRSAESVDPSSFHNVYPCYISQQHQGGTDDDGEDCTVRKLVTMATPDWMEPAVSPHTQPSNLQNVSCTLQQLTSDPDLYVVSLEGCGLSEPLFDTSFHLLDDQGTDPVDETPHVWPTDCPAPTGSPVLHYVMEPPAPSPSAAVPVQLRIATDESFTSFHPATHLPLSLLRDGTVHLELRLLDPQENSLLVHYCLAHTEAPCSSWSLIYDGCSSRSDLQVLPTPYPHNIRRIITHSFLPPPYTAHLDPDPEIYFVCLTELCPSGASECTVSCMSPGSVM